MSEFVIEAKNIVKIFPGVRALDGVNLQIKKGTVHALVGENGAGKSTLMHTLGGIHQPDEGEIFLEGKKVSFSNAHEALKSGISIVHQELSLIPCLSVAENIFANQQPVNGLGLIKRQQLNDKAKKMLGFFDIYDLDPNQLVNELSIANQQVVEILKAMAYEPKVLILDEPTSSLTEIETQQLFRNIRTLKEKGISFIYISHHLQEIFEIADEVTILRDGKYICSAAVKDIDEDFLITNMVGRKIEKIYGERPPQARIGEVKLEVQNLCRKNIFQNISFQIRSGEIVSFSGLVGAGRTEIGRAIFGAEPATSGKVLLNGKEIHVKNPEEAIRLGIGYMSEDRKEEGLYVQFSIKENMIANRLRTFSKHGYLQEKDIDSIVSKAVSDYHVSTPSIFQKVGNLSGGNQQKVLLASWFGIDPQVLIVDEPTRGVDIGAKSEIYTLLRELAATGVAILVISSDLPEVLGISDRIIVIREGQVAGEISASEATEENVIALASGVTNK